MRHVGLTGVTAFLAIVSTVIPAPTFADTPEGVSPGALDWFSEVEGRCPTFSWGEVPDAEQYEVVGYRIPPHMDADNIDMSYAEEVLATRVAGGATSWTPDLAQCLAPGERYIWFVRALFDAELEEEPTASEWSFGRLFAISRAPSMEELNESLRVLRRYLELQPASGAQVVAGIADPASRARDTAPDHGARRAQSGESKSATTAPTAIKGHVSGSSGENYGVVGISDSSDGAGIAAANTAGGADLVLDGSEDSLPDALLSESGIDRPWGSSQTFNIRNSAGTGMTLQVDGQPVGMIAQLNPGSGLTGGGSSGTVSLGIGTGAVTATHLGTDSVGAAEISSGAVGSDEILNGSITYSDTNVDSVQRRVTGTCGSHQSIKSISNTGTVACEWDDFNSIGYTTEMFASVYNGGYDYAIWGSANSTTMCFLTTVQLRDVDSGGEDAWCRVYVASGLWTLEAHSEDDADAWCGMRCLLWGSRSD